VSKWSPKFKKGDKVFPIDKTPLGRLRGLDSSVAWARAKDKGLNYLVVEKAPFNSDEYQEYMVDGDFFHEEDLITLEESQKEGRVGKPQMPEDLDGIISYYSSIPKEILVKVFKAGYRLGMEE
jgi:hypothetical protein